MQFKQGDLIIGYGVDSGREYTGTWTGKALGFMGSLPLTVPDKKYTIYVDFETARLVHPTNQSALSLLRRD